MNRLLWAAVPGTRLSRRSRLPAGTALGFRSGDLRFTCSSSTAPALGLRTWPAPGHARQAAGQSQIPQPGRGAAGIRLLHAQGSCCPCSREPREPGGTVLLPQPSALPAPSPGDGPLRSCRCVLPGLAGIIDHPQLRWAGSSVSEEGHSLVVEWHEGTCTLSNDAALRPETHSQRQLFGWTPLTPGFHSCSVTGGAETLLGPVLALLPAIPAHPSPRTWQLVHPIHPH